MTKLLLNQMLLRGKRVLVRVDFNVSLDSQQNIIDDTRIRATIPTLQHIVFHGGIPILMSHLGRPKGKVESSLSLYPCAKKLQDLMNIPVLFTKQQGTKLEKEVANLKPGTILLLENLRFSSEESTPNPPYSLAQSLANLGDCYINDAFGSSHRKHSSTFYLPKLFPEQAGLGFLIHKEIQALSLCLNEPKHPFYAIIGGSKISSKIGVLKTLVQKSDGLFIGGAMAHTFLKVKGYKIGQSLYEKEYLEEAKQLLQYCDKHHKSIHLPTDALCVKTLNSENPAYAIKRFNENIQIDDIAVDIGPQTTQTFIKYLKPAQTILWNGPLGITEIETFTQGTQSIAQFLAQSSAKTVIGGGDSIAAIKKLKMEKKFYHLSTGGGASLEFIANLSLPSIEVLSNSFNSKLLSL